MHKLGKSLLITLMTATSVPVSAAPIAYSINSDSGSANEDSLYRIDLATGTDTLIGQVKSLGQIRFDVEGLAIAPDGTLYGVDDESMTLFPINPDNGMVDAAHEAPIDGLPMGGRHDFGMTFACDGKLYITSVISGSLFSLGLDGKATQIGSDNALGVNISALAAYGEPVKLYGLGNGLNSELQPETPNLYEIDLNTGQAVEIGPLQAAAPYTEGGLAFDDTGQLWAITDRRVPDSQPSQVMKVDLVSGNASEIRTTSEVGFESLAITVPRGCQTGGSGEHASFKVQKQFVDGNNQTPVTLNIRCTTGLPLEQSFTVVPNEGPNGNYEVNFTVEQFEDGALDCEIWEDEIAGYAGSYECFSEGACESTGSACAFSETRIGQDNLCVIRNHPDAVEVVVSAEWLYDGEANLPGNDSVNVDLYCRNVFDGDGQVENGVMHWYWSFEPGSPDQIASVYPDWNGSTECRTETTASSSAVETTGTCMDWRSVMIGDGQVTCQVTNTVFFERIPTLNPFGMLLLAVSMLFAGTIAVRRL